METKESGPLVGRRVVIGSIGDDIHVVGITILGHALRDAGAEVIQLGIQSQPEEFVRAGVDEDADAVFVSSSNGHARIFCEGLPAAFAAEGADDLLLYVGGNIAVSAASAWPSVESTFLGLGFDRAFPPKTPPQVAIDALVTDLNSRNGAHVHE